MWKGTYIGWEHSLWHLAIAARSVGAGHDAVHHTAAEVQRLSARDFLKHGAEDQGRVEVRDAEGGLLLLDEGPDGFFGDLFADAVGDLAQISYTSIHGRLC